MGRAEEKGKVCACVCVWAHGNSGLALWVGLKGVPTGSAGAGGDDSSVCPVSALSPGPPGLWAEGVCSTQSG